MRDNFVNGTIAEKRFVCQNKLIHFVFSYFPHRLSHTINGRELGVWGVLNAHLQMLSVLCFVSHVFMKMGVLKIWMM